MWAKGRPLIGQRFHYSLCVKYLCCDYILYGTIELSEFIRVPIVLNIAGQVYSFPVQSIMDKNIVQINSGVMFWQCYDFVVMTLIISEHLNCVIGVNI